MLGLILALYMPQPPQDIFEKFGIKSGGSIGIELIAHDIYYNWTLNISKITLKGGMTLYPPQGNHQLIMETSFEFQGPRIDRTRTSTLSLDNASLQKGTKAPRPITRGQRSFQEATNFLDFLGENLVPGSL